MICCEGTPVPETKETDRRPQSLMIYQNLSQAGTSPETGQSSLILSLGVEKSDSKTSVGGGQALGILTSKGMTRFSEKMASHRDGWEKRNTPF